MQNHVANLQRLKQVRQLIPSSLRAKLTLGLLPGLIALFSLAGISLYVAQMLVSTNQHLAETGWELAQTSALQFKIQQALVPLDYYVDHGVGDLARDEFEKLATEVDQLFGEVAAIYDEAREHQLLNRARSEWRNLQQLGIGLLTGSLGTVAATDATLQEVHDAAVGAERALQELHTFVEAEMEQTVAEAEAAYRLALRLLVGSAVATMLAGSLFIFIFSRYVSHPIQILQAAANQIGRGELDRPIYLPQRDELGMLASVFNQMRSNLQRSHKRLAERTVQLEQVSTERERYAHRLRQVLQRTVQIQEDERQRIANDIHDGISQWLLGALFELQAARLQLAETNGANSYKPVEQHMVEAQRVLKDAKEEMRRVIHNLHPPLLESHGLLVAMRGHIDELAAHTPLQCELKTAGTPRRLSLPKELAVFRIAQEALHNVLKHAGVNQATAVLEFGPDTVCLIISDQGRGFATPIDAENNGDELPHLGLLSMQERAQAVGGQCAIMADPGRGVRVEVCISAADTDELAQPRRPENVPTMLNRTRRRMQ